MLNLLFSIVAIITFLTIGIFVFIYFKNKKYPMKDSDKMNFTKANLTLDNQIYQKPPVFVINTNGLQLNYASSVRDVQDVGKMYATLNVYDPQNINVSPIVDNINIIFTGHGASTRDLPKPG